MSNNKFVVPTQEVLEYIKENITCDPLTGILKKKGKPFGAKNGFNKQEYLSVKIKGMYKRAHQIAWFIYYGVWPEHIIDHKDGDGSNNTKDNLRETNHSQNMQNSTTKRNRRSDYKGVVPTSSKKWVAFIHIDWESKYLGTFATEKEAAEAYNKAALEMFGEYAKLNIIP